MSEKEHEIKLVALDMDGTLLNDENEVSKHTQEMIAKALAQDVHIVLSTGRSLGTCFPFAEMLNVMSYIITSNGGEIWTVSKALLERHLLHTDDVEMMWNLGDKAGIHMWMEATDAVYGNSSRPEDFYAHEWLKFGFATSNKKELGRIAKRLSAHGGLELTNSLPTNMEINPAGVNKARALKRVCNEIGITMNEVMAVGDSLNDFKMIQKAGIGVAVGNAQEAIIDVADFVTETNNNDGVAKAIERFVL